MQWLRCLETYIRELLYTWVQSFTLACQYWSHLIYIMANLKTTVNNVAYYIIFFTKIMSTLGSSHLFKKYVTSGLSFNSTPATLFNGVDSTIECGSLYLAVLGDVTLLQSSVAVNSFTLDQTKNACQIGFTATDAVAVAQGLSVWALCK